MDDDWYYDNDEEPDDDADEEHWLSIDRVYGLDWTRFAETDWDRLDRIYRSLPGARQFTPATAQWFSDDEERELHLGASVEPPGLQIGGVLTVGMWRRWDDAFRAAVVDAGLPRYRCA